MPIIKTIIRIGVTTLTLSSLFACGGSGSSGGSSDTSTITNQTSSGPTNRPASGPCHELSTGTCALPFPSNDFTVKDDDSPTGLRLHFADTQVDSKLLDPLPANLNLQAIFNDSDGFSAATPIVFEFQQAIDSKALAASNSSIIAINLATGEHHPISAAVSAYALFDLHQQPSNIVEVFPRTRWDFKASYVVAITKALKPSEGEVLKNAEQMNLKALEYAQKRNLLESLNEAGISNDQLLTLTSFTVRSEESATGKLRTATAWNYEQDHPVRNIYAQYFNPEADGSIAAFVYGEVLSYDFRNKQSMAIDGRVDKAKMRPTWLKFRLTLPRQANKASVPVALYGHGLALFKESDFFTAANDNAEMGIATLSIDHPNHGSRIAPEGGYLPFLSTSPAGINYPISMFFQGSIDLGSMLDSLMQHLKHADVLPMPKKVLTFPFHTQIDMNNWQLPANIRTQGDGIAELDTSRVFFQTTSLGGVVGAPFISLTPYDIRGSLLRVPGVGVMRILSESVLWDRWFHQLVPRSASGAQAVLLRTAATHLLDYGDGINFVHYIKQPPADESWPAKRVAIIAVEGDFMVPNSATAAFAELAQLPLIGDVKFPVYNVARLNDWDNGSGIMQFPAGGKMGQHDIDGLIAHVSFILPYIQKDMKEWIRKYVIAKETQARTD